VKLTAVHFDDLVPIPETSRREMTFASAEGWDVDRLDDGRIRIRGEERRNGEVHALDFVAEGFGCTYPTPRDMADGWQSEPTVVAVPEPEPAVEAPKRRRRA
jgi:hypothetical protein